MRLTPSFSRGCQITYTTRWSSQEANVCWWQGWSFPVDWPADSELAPSSPSLFATTSSFPSSSVTSFYLPSGCQSCRGTHAAHTTLFYMDPPRMLLLLSLTSCWLVLLKTICQKVACITLFLLTLHLLAVLNPFFGGYLFISSFFLFSYVFICWTSAFNSDLPIWENIDI